MRVFILTSTLAAALLLALSTRVQAVDDPHGTTNAIDCSQCHITHGSLGEILANSPSALMSTLCLSCHTPGGWVPMTRTLSASDIAVPGVSGTSHAWDVDGTNAARGALPPQNTTLLAHLAADGSITCTTCHDPHDNSNPPFLRLDNSADALCLDCHRPRDNASVKTWTGSELSHPVQIALPSGTGWHNPPLDADGNPQPSDGNTTNDLILNGGVVRCTTCHGVHYTDSNSSTVDGP